MQKHIKGGCLGVVGFVCIISAVIVGWVVVPNALESKIKQQARLEPQSDIWSKWKDIPVPIKLKFYFFNVTNPEDFNDDEKWDAKPNVTEVGPYVYLQKRIKFNIIHNDENDTVTYRQNLTYHFNRELSVGGEDDLINLINAPLISAVTVLATEAHKLPPGMMGELKQSVINALVNNLKTEKFIRTSIKVGDIIFNGVDASNFQTLTTFIKPTEGEASQFYNGKFALYMGKNQTDEGLFEVYSGKKNTSMFGVIKSVNKASFLAWWNGTYCSTIKGTDGMMFPPFVKRNKQLNIHIPEACRSLSLLYKRDTEYKGIPVYRYELDPNTYSSPSIKAENECFCSEILQPLNDTCYNGAARLSACKNGAPITVSKPHFLDADEYLTDGVNGLSPDVALHETNMDIEPLSGYSLRANIRFQISVEVQSLPFNGSYSLWPHILFPMIWVDAEAGLDDDLASDVRARLVSPLRVVSYTKWTVIAIGIVLILSSVAVFIVTHYRIKTYMFE